MKKIIYFVFMMVAVMLVCACDDDETYADKVERERKAITQFIADSSVNVITESQFEANNYRTDVSRNEYVFFSSSGVYMQIIRQGCGEKLKDGETATVLCRFDETNLLTDSLQLSNNVLAYSSIVEKMTVKNTSGTFTASFIAGSSLMYYAYQSLSVPAGWLVPLSYINLGRPSKEGDEVAKVKIVVPHAQGHSYASQNVYPCLYEITYERGI